MLAEHLEAQVARADLLVDTTDVAHPDLSLLLARAAAKAHVRTMLGVTVGSGIVCYVFSPCGVIVEQYVGSPEQMAWRAVRALYR